MKRNLFDSIMFAYLCSILAAAIWHPSEEDMLNLQRNSLFFAVAMAIGAGLSIFFNSHGQKTLGEMVFAPAHKKAQASHDTLFNSLWGWQLLVFTISTLVVGFIVTRVSILELFDEQGYLGARNLFQQLGQPEWSLLPQAVVKIIETIFMAFTATALAIPIAFVLSFMSAKNVMKSPSSFVVYLFLRTVMNVTRSIEALIWAIIFSVWVGIGPFAGMLALMVHSIASLTKQYSEIVETVSEGPIEGIMSTGANTLQTIWYAIVPQVILPYISFTIYRWDINIRMATIIGLVGGGGIGTLFIQYQGQAMWSEVGTIIVVIAFVVWFMDTASAYVREALK